MPAAAQRRQAARAAAAAVPAPTAAPPTAPTAAACASAPGASAPATAARSAWLRTGPPTAASVLRLRRQPSELRLATDTWHRHRHKAHSACPASLEFLISCCAASCCVPSLHACSLPCACVSDSWALSSRLLLLILWQNPRSPCPRLLLTLQFRCTCPARFNPVQISATLSCAALLPRKLAVLRGGRDAETAVWSSRSSQTADCRASATGCAKSRHGRAGSW